VHKTEYDAVVIGSGPNGLAAGITLQRAGLSVLIVEGKDTIGGGMRSQALTLPGFVHDVCSAVHPMALLSPFFKKLPLRQFGLEFIQPVYAAAHPFDGGTAATLEQSLENTAGKLGVDASAYQALMEPLLADIPELLPALLGPFSWPAKPLSMAKFGMKALPPATWLAGRFKTKEARGLWAGMAAHAIQPLQNMATSAFGMMLMAAAHLNGWPIPKGGSQSIADALAGYFRSLGGEIATDLEIRKWSDLPGAKVVVADITPRQLLRIAGERLSSSYRSRLEKFRYGAGVFKIDWALDGVIPFSASECKDAGTVHLGNTLEEIADYEKSVSEGRHSEKPFVLVAQQSSFDSSRAPEGKHVAWAYCHVPHGSTVNMTAAIEKQVERFAPGFRDLIKARHTMNTAEMEAYNPNYIGGDINGGIQDIWQLYTRPVLSISPYRTSAKDIYLCSSSAPPGGGVHGMCGYHAARQVLEDVFKIKNSDF
jgi:phytoene dehydrogenase-like protein